MALYHGGTNTSTTLKDGKVSPIEGFACFSHLFHDNTLKELRYYARLRPEYGINHEIALWYIDFMRQMFPADELEWEAKTVEVKTGDEPGEWCVLWTMKTFSPNRPKNLLYCTAFRLIDEFGSMIKQLYDAREQYPGTGGLFTGLYECHCARVCRCDPKTGMPIKDNPYQLKFPKLANLGLAGHDLIAPSDGGYYSGSSATPITLARFHQNLKDNTSKSVYGFFR